MTELLQELFNIIQLVPTNVAFMLFAAIIIFLVKGQMTINKENNDFKKKTESRLNQGANNFEMIDAHFLKVSEHFNKIETQIKEGNDTIKVNMDAMHRMILKDIIYNDTMDIHERQEAYDKYVALGGNGMTKEYYKRVLLPLVQKHIDEIDSE